LLSASAYAFSDIALVINPVSSSISPRLIISTSPNTASIASLSAFLTRTKYLLSNSEISLSYNFSSLIMILMFLPIALAASITSETTALAVGSLPAPLP